jgi:hypothetical protein
VADPRHADVMPAHHAAGLALRQQNMNTQRLWSPLVWSAFLCLGATACSSTRTTYLEDGGRGYSLSCKGSLNSWQNCLIKAGRICESRGYRTIAADEYERTMLVTCKEPGSAK